MKTHTTNYTNTLILPAEDCPVAKSELPEVKAKPTVATMQFDKIAHHDYEFTSDDIVFGYHADKNEIPHDKRKAEREAFFSKGQPCLRTSPLAKRYGWALHHDADGKVALIDTSSQVFKTLVADESVKKVYAMRSSRK